MSSRKTLNRGLYRKMLIEISKLEPGKVINKNLFKDLKIPSQKIQNGLYYLYRSGEIEKVPDTKGLYKTKEYDVVFDTIDLSMVDAMKVLLQAMHNALPLLEKLEQVQKILKDVE